jgi:hypothetical protein
MKFYDAEARRRPPSWRVIVVGSLRMMLLVALLFHYAIGDTWGTATFHSLFFGLGVGIGLWLRRRTGRNLATAVAPRVNV